MAIIALAGKKGSGKNTAANYIIGEVLRTAYVIREFHITSEGKLFVHDIFGNSNDAGILDITQVHPQNKQFFENEVYPFVKQYSFADELKNSVCMNILGLTYEQCYGTDEQKNEPTHLYWGNMPGVVDPQDILEFTSQPGLMIERFGLLEHKPEQMTAREVMQYVGTNIFRKMYNNVWVDATIRKIRQEMPEVAIITDCRFPNEVLGTKQAGGRVIRLTRAPYAKDNHDSETALDENKFDWKNFDVILYNDHISIQEQNKEIDNIMVNLGILQKVL